MVYTSMALPGSVNWSERLIMPQNANNQAAPAAAMIVWPE
jgi:hypothetical protein